MLKLIFTIERTDDASSHRRLYCYTNPQIPIEPVAPAAGARIMEETKHKR